jgi:hypothetical protein
LRLFYLVAGATDNRGEDSPGGVITGETGLAHAGAIVNDKSGSVLVTHPGCRRLTGLTRAEEPENSVSDE